MALYTSPGSDVVSTPVSPAFIRVRFRWRVGYSGVLGGACNFKFVEPF